MILGLAASGHENRPALIEPARSRVMTHGALAEAVDHAATVMAGAKGLVLVAAAADLDRVVAWLGAMQAGHAVMLLPPDLAPARLAGLIAAYRPHWLLGWSEQPGYGLVNGALQRRRGDDGPILHDDLGLLLSTSGSAGSPRMVRLSRQAVGANARAIAAALGLSPDDRAATTLPLSYSYGLSILHSHLAAGASVVLTDQSLLSRGFWDMAGATGLSWLAGVPFQWQSLRRLDMTVLAPASLRFATQAGGRLDPRLTQHFHHLLAGRGGGLFSMYGQTEATARMTILPPSQLPDRAGSVGLAIPGGAIAIEAGQVVYRGGNVMMGYAVDHADLALGDHMGGVLPTGDLGHVDADGYLWLDGRPGRVVKVVGLRLDLDEVQARAATLGPAAALLRGDDLVLLLAVPVPDAATRAAFAADLGMPAAAIRWRQVPAIPLGDNGKPDVMAAEALL